MSLMNWLSLFEKVQSNDIKFNDYVDAIYEHVLYPKQDDEIDEGVTGLRGLEKIFENGLGRIPYPFRIDLAYELQKREPLANEYSNYLQDYLECALGTDNPQKVEALMQERFRKRDTFPEYLPNQAPYAMRIGLFSVTGNRAKQSILNALKDQQDILAVGNRDNIADLMRLNSNASLGRAGLRAYIEGGRIYMGGDYFDTTGMISHLKLDFAAVTVNVFGEISVFNHRRAFEGSRGLYHGATNAEAPLFYAGEMKAGNGLITGITTQSDHYRPTLYNLYRFVLSLVELGADLSQCYLYLFNVPSREPILRNLKIETVKFEKKMFVREGYGEKAVDATELGYYPEPRFKVKALEFLAVIRKALAKELSVSAEVPGKAAAPEVYNSLRRGIEMGCF